METTTITWGLFGGSFDPPHRAHVLVVAWALMEGLLDRVAVIPTARHAFGKQPGAPFADRVAMCERAFSIFPEQRVVVDPIEGRREGTSYMIDTLRELERRHPGVAFRLIVGSDVADDLPRWREGEEVVRRAPPIVVPRQLVTEGDSAPTPGALPLLSSTDVRRALETGNDIGPLVPRAVADYIRARGLYGTDQR